jgi:hypothetical protein
MQSVGAGIRPSSGPGYFSPHIFGIADGLQIIGRSIDVAAGAMDSTVASLSQSAGMSQTKAQNDRRADDWEWQSVEARAEIDRITDSLRDLESSISMAELDRQLLQRSTEQQQEMEAYVMGRFANQELFSWLARRLTSMYFQSFSMALSFARDAHMAFETERGVACSLSLPKALTSLHGGLLAGDELQLWLAQLKKEFKDTATDRLEVEKIFSVSTLAADHELGPLVCKDWDELKKNKGLQITLPKDLFIEDGQGDKPRKILSVAVSLYAIVGPFQTFNATLINNETDREIAISRGADDEGILDASYYQDRYKPFEGLEIMNSNWSLQFHKENDVILDNLSDVVFRVRYWVPRITG